MFRFAGLGRYGKAKYARASALAEDGRGAAPRSLEDGYLSLDFLHGRACSEPCAELCDAVAEHLAFVVRRFPAGRTPPIGRLEHMVATNIAEGIGRDRSARACDKHRLSNPRSVSDRRKAPAPGRGGSQ